MEEHKPLVVDLVNRLIAAVSGLFGKRFHGDPLPAQLVMAFLVTVLIILFFRLAARRLDLFPRPLQSFLEAVYTFFRTLIDDMIGHEGRRFLPALGTLFIFIASCNLIGLVPEMASPTSNINVTAGCALFIFLYYNYQGVRKHGVWGYIKTFMGPVWWLSWLFLPIEIISHFSRPLSLTVRLFGNIYGEDLVIAIIAGLVPWIAPLPMMGLAIFTSLIQAFVFVMLSTVYLAGATAAEH